MQGKAEDAGGLTPVKDGNAAMRTLYLRTFARNSDDCYSIPHSSPSGNMIPGAAPLFPTIDKSYKEC